MPLKPAAGDIVFFSTDNTIRPLMLWRYVYSIDVPGLECPTPTPKKQDIAHCANCLTEKARQGRAGLFV